MYDFIVQIKNENLTWAYNDVDLDDCIRIIDHDSRTDFIRKWDTSTEEQAVNDYFKNWCEIHSRVDFTPQLEGGNGIYWITKQGE